MLVVLHLADIGAPAGPPLWGDTRLLRGVLPPGATIPFGPLWFLAVYLVVVAVAPGTIWLHRRFGLWVPAAMVARRGGLRRDRVHGRPSRSHAGATWRSCCCSRTSSVTPTGTAACCGGLASVFWAMVAAGLGGLVLLTNPPFWQLFGDVRHTWFPGIGAYPKSLLGTDVEAVSNAYPPTLCFLLGGVWSIGAAMLLRDRANRWLQHRRPWTFTVAVNGVIMTLFLWHMTAYLLAILLLWPLGFGQETDSTLRWWLERPIWIVVPGRHPARPDRDLRPLRAPSSPPGGGVRAPRREPAVAPARGPPARKAVGVSCVHHHPAQPAGAISWHTDY